jgi:hypothetical protein
VPTPAAAPVGDETADAWRKWLGGSTLMIAIRGAVSLTAGELTSFRPAIPIIIWAAGPPAFREHASTLRD